MASRKQEKERLRQARLAAEQAEKAQQRRRLVIGYVSAGILGGLVLAGIVVAIASSSGGGSASGTPAEAAINLSIGSLNGATPDGRTGTKPPPIRDANLGSAAKAAGCTLALNLPDYGHQHVKPGTKIHYKGEPPTSGNHVLPPFQQADGAYLTEPAPLDFVHSLEHSRIELEYAPDLPKADQLAIKGVFDESPSGVLMFPNKQLPDAAAAAAWRNRMNCPTYKGAKTLDALRDFRDRFRGTAGREFGYPIQP
jgi:uncharacterized protein DUF3105